MRTRSATVLIRGTLLAALLAAAPALAGDPDVTDFGSHQPRNPAARSEAGIERMEISRHTGVVTSRLLGADDAALGTLRIQWPGDDTVQLELTRGDDVWAGTWVPATRRLTVYRAGEPPSGAAVWEPGESARHGRWQTDDIADPTVRRMALVLGHGYAETVNAMGLWAWQ